MGRPTSVTQTDEEQIRIRSRVALAAYAYEIHNDSLLSDAEFDSLCLQVDVSKKTGNEEFDRFFEDEFDPSSGVWIHRHPEKEKLEYLYRSLSTKKEKKNE